MTEMGEGGKPLETVIVEFFKAEGAFQEEEQVAGAAGVLCDAEVPAGDAGVPAGVAAAPAAVEGGSGAKDGDAEPSGGAEPDESDAPLSDEQVSALTIFAVDLENHGFASSQMDSHPDLHINPEEAWQANQMRKLMHLVVETLSCHTWAFCTYSSNMPEMCAVVFLPAVSEAKRLMQELRGKWKVVERAESIAFVEPAAGVLVPESAYMIKRCIDAMGWPYSQLVREWAKMADDNDWSFRAKDVRASSFNMWGGVETVLRIPE
jgi:hypothetical protein